MVTSTPDANPDLKAEIADKPVAKIAPQDHENASRLISSCVEGRRFWMGVLSILFPVATIFCFDVAQWIHPELGFLQGRVFTFTAIFLLGVSTLTQGIILRNHAGMVINGTKLRKLEGGAIGAPGGFNWLGVNAGILYLIIFHGCLSIIVLGLSLPLPPLVISSALFIYCVGSLLFAAYMHTRASRRAVELMANVAALEPGQIAAASENHLTASIEDADQDIMAGATTFLALFAAYMTALGALGQIERSAPIDFPAELLISSGAQTIFGLCFFVSLFFLVMVIRLRIAIGKFSSALSKLNNEEDNPFSPRLEKSFFTYELIVLVGTAACYVFLRLLEVPGSIAAGPTLLFLAGGTLAYWTALLIAGQRQSNN